MNETREIDGLKLGMLLPISQRDEAIKRLNIMCKKGLIKEARDYFLNNDIAIFERQNSMFSAVLYSLNLNITNSKYMKLKSKIDNFQKKYNAIVYLVQLTHTSFGDCYSFFYVSDSQDEWEFDKDDLETSYKSNAKSAYNAVVYVWNATDEDCSEFGTIGFTYKMGGVCRVR